MTTPMRMTTLGKTPRSRSRWVALLVAALVAGCASLDIEQRKLIFMPSQSQPQYETRTQGMDDVWIEHQSTETGKPVKLHALWYPHSDPMAPILLYLHGARRSVQGNAFRIRHVHELGFAVLARYWLLMLVVTVSAAETADRGGSAVLLGACDADTIARPAAAPSLLEPAASPTRTLAAAVEEALARDVPVVGVSLVLDHPRLTGRYRGYPWSPDSVRSATRSPLRSLLNTLPGGARRHALQAMGRDLQAAAALAGPPSVAHAEALLRGIALRGARLDEPLDTILVPLPWKAPHQPRQPLNPVTAAATGLGLALRLWREQSPLREGGTVVLMHDLHRAFGHGPQAPFRVLFQALRDGREPGLVATARAGAREDAPLLTAYRDGRGPHPLLPFVDWEAAGPVLRRAGRVIVAGCRDAGAARALGFVPSHNVATALEMARGVAGGSHRLGVLLAPPYAPLIVGGEVDVEPREP